jgi:predicted XRE-type DNA-binding protein
MIVDIDMGSGNVYADLSLDDAEAMHVKASLTAKIAEILDQRQLAPPEAAATLGISQADLAGLLRGEFRDLTDEKLIEMLNRLGRDVEIVIRIAPRHQAQGHTSVIYG